MTRVEMLEKLHNIKFGAEATVATMDMGLQYDYVSSTGAGTGFGGMGRWPAYYFGKISSEELALLRKKIRDKSLTDDDFSNTILSGFHTDVFLDIDRLDEQIPYTNYADLLILPEDYEGELYCLCDAGQWNPELFFYTSEAALINAFEEQYVYDIVPWNEMSDDELEGWIDRIDSGLQGIDLIDYTEEEEQ